MPKSALLCLLLLIPTLAHSASEKKGTITRKYLTREESLAFLEKYAAQALDGKGYTRSPSEQDARQKIDQFLGDFCSASRSEVCYPIDAFLGVFREPLATIEKMNKDRDARTRDVAELVEHYRKFLDDEKIFAPKCEQLTFENPDAQPRVEVSCGDSRSVKFEINFMGRIRLLSYHRIELK